MTNRIARYDGGEWLKFLILNKLIDYGEPVVATYEAMAQNKADFYFEGDDEENT
jgi:hypothetical protein